MLDFSKFKIFITISICIAAILLIVPNFVSNSEEKLGTWGKYSLNPGLDLRGGSYLLLEVDFNKFLTEQLSNVRDEIRKTLREEKVADKPIYYSGGLRISDNKIILNLNDKSQTNQVRDYIEDISEELSVNKQGDILEIGYSELAVEKMQKSVIEQSMEIVRRRIDETGTREPDIQRQGDNRILLQVPGLENPEQLKEILGQTAKMTFHLLDESRPYPDNENSIISASSIRLKSDSNDNYFTVKKKIAISGDLLKSARSGFNQNGAAVVNISFNNLGAKKFADITKSNIGKPFAIVLDNKILTAPVIRSAILDGRAEISGDFTPSSAANLALLLRAGSLPAPLSIIEERTVGPTLGADSVKAGTTAVIIGFILVIIFMALNYGLFGLIADIALIFNIIFILALLSLFGATLTLPGIAGIVLTIGMAVDANVLIFERIKEEEQLGKTLYASINNGFKQAYGTILDANITTLLAAIILFNFGSGPIKGFAVTLSIGIITSIFSAMIISRMLIILWLKKTKPQKINW